MKMSTGEMQAMAAERMSLAARVKYVALLLVAVGGTGVIGSLWATEPALPARTQLAFAVILAVNLAWAGFAAWVLTRRRVLLARHSVVAARMAVTFSAVFVLLAAGIGYWGGAGRPMYSAAIFGLVMLSVAAALLVRADRRLQRLLERRREIEEAIGAQPRPAGR